ncbi:hypothetical protein L7F22_051346 [Adiantum nelumboides]|nr:hypothetical protein [Adiantum nelumboides]
MAKLWWLSVAYATIFICGAVLSKHAVASNYGKMDWKRAQEVDLIKDGLPGQLEVQFKQYSGYITVNASTGRALFYSFIEADSHSAHKKPLILWLSGGPGCSSIAFGAMKNIGPFRVLPNASGLSIRTHAWNKARDAHTFFVKWFERFPQYKGRVFYIMGDSYAGHYVPQLAKLVYENNVKGVENPDMNLKGLLVGNGVLDNYYNIVGLIEYWWDHALISDTSYDALLAACDFHEENVSATCTDLIGNVFVNELGDIDPYSIYSPVCLTQSQSRRPAASRLINSPGYDPCLGNYAEVYFNRPDVQNALHANLTGKSLFPLEVDESKEGAIYPPLCPVFAFPVAGRCQAYKGLSLVTVRNAGHEVPYTQPGRAYVLIKSYLASDDTPLLPRNKTS